MSSSSECLSWETCAEALESPTEKKNKKTRKLFHWWYPLFHSIGKTSLKMRCGMDVVKHLDMQVTSLRSWTNEYPF